MTVETKYNLNDLVRYRESKDNILLDTIKIGKITSVGFMYSGENNIYTTYSVVNPENPLDACIVLEQQIIGRA